jgi:hypothetical protein
VVKLGGVEQPGFFGAPVTETATGFTWKRTVSGAADGEYTVEVSLIDEAGNASGALAAAGFSIDSSVPQVTGLAVSPGRIRGVGTVTATFDTSEALPVGGAVATVGTRAMSCGAYQAASPSYTCTYAMTGTELAAGTEASQTVLVAATDAAGNPGQAVGGIVFDFKAPTVVSTSANPANAKGGDQLVYTINVS